MCTIHLSYHDACFEDLSSGVSDLGISTGKLFTSFRTEMLRPSSDSIGSIILAIETTT